MPDDTEQLVANIVARSWSDPEFRKRLFTDTRGACAECGLTYPDNVEVRVIEDTPSIRHIHLPPVPSDDQLGVQYVGGDAAVGSSCGTCRCFEASV
ncbi:nitrile hydratase subunit alpha [Caballeronia arationis]|uniref:nitrile hydratase subunit alpha n=1 Tax=Caballeronia arationis TaxID=1777142 RepID=UPI000B34D246